MKRAFTAAALCVLTGCTATMPVSRWELTSGPLAQNVSCVLSEEREPSRLLAGLTNGDIFTSSDAGATWTLLHRSPERGLVYRLVQHPEHPENLFAATAGGMFSSTDAGHHWTPARIEGGSALQKQAACLSLVVDPWKPSSMFAGLQGKGIYRSTDGGTNWSPALLGTDPRLALSDARDIAIGLARPDVLYAALAGPGIVRSTNAGVNWRVISQEMGGKDDTPTCLLVHRSAAQLVLYGTTSGAIFKSTDGGESWTQTRKTTEHERIISLLSLPASHETVFAGTESGVFQSTDFGGTWHNLTAPLPSLPTKMAVSPSAAQPALFAFGSGVGFCSSDDGGTTWIAEGAGLGGGAATFIIASKEDDRVYSVVEGTVFSYDATTNSWDPAGSGLRGGKVTSLSFDQDSLNTIYATTPAGMFQTTSGGEEWLPFGRTLQSPPFLITAHPWYHTRLISGGENGVFYSTNRGKSWAQSRPINSTFQVRSITFTPTNAGLLHAATSDMGVVVSENGGLSWEPRRFGLDSAGIVAVTLDQDDPLTLYAWSTSGKCFRTTNAGIEWNRYTTPWGSSQNVAIAFDASQPSDVIALVDGTEIHHSASGGATWQLLQSGGPHIRPTALYWNSENAELLVGTAESGIFRISLTHQVEKWREEE